MKIAVVIPCFKVDKLIFSVLDQIGSEVDKIYVIDDHCPNQTGALVERFCRDIRIRVLRHSLNKGVGAAVMTGYQAAINDGMEVIIKLDGDGQMDPRLINEFISPILSGAADYTKGNRFFYIEGLKKMPKLRIFGNAILSFINKFSSGYWNIFDPTNGFTAIRTSCLKLIPFSKVSERYFFECDMLFRLNIINAVVLDIPMYSVYGEEKSNLVIKKIFFEFILKHLINFYKRIFYKYYLRDLSIASIEFLLGIILFNFGIIFGINEWVLSFKSNVPATAGTVMLAALPIICGLQFLLSFLNFDINSTPRR